METTNEVMPVVDIHRHCLDGILPIPNKASESGSSINESGLVVTDDYIAGTNEGVTLILYTEVLDLDRQVKGQTEGGVTKGLLSFSIFSSFMGELSNMQNKSMSELTSWINDMTTAMVARYPTELDFMAFVNPFEEGSIDEFERCITKLGAKGVSIVSSVNGEFLDSAQLNPFWEYAQAKDAAIFIHPPMLPIGYQKMNRYKLEEVVGRPFDTTMNIARMIYSGVFDRYPRLKVALAHMGGGMPSVLGRLDFGYRLGYGGMLDGEAAVCKFKPSEYLRTNLYVDTMGLSATGVQQCIELFGVDRVLLGTDYPAVPISPKEHIDIVKGLGLHPLDQAKILWKNADDLFRLGLTEQGRVAATREG
jgi:predicted TIM-barrel fold metal-dependent hydrolase